MQKKYIVRLTSQERGACHEVIRKLTGTSQKVRRAQILLKADAEGPGWSDRHIAEAFSCRTRTVETIRQRFVEQGFEQTLERKQSTTPPANKVLDGEREASMVSGRQRSLPRDWDHLRPGTAAGRSGYWRAQWSNWKSWTPSVTRRSGRC